VDPLVALTAAAARGDQGAEAAASAVRSKGDAGGPSFSDTLDKAVESANRLQNEADDALRRFAAGDVEDVHQVMLAMNRADLSFRMTLEVRNKLVDAYQEVMRMQV